MHLSSSLDFKITPIDRDFDNLHVVYWGKERGLSLLKCTLEVWWEGERAAPKKNLPFGLLSVRKNLLFGLLSEKNLPFGLLSLRKKPSVWFTVCAKIGVWLAVCAKIGVWLVVCAKIDAWLAICAKIGVWLAVYPKIGVCDGCCRLWTKVSLWELVSVNLSRKIGLMVDEWWCRDVGYFVMDLCV